MPQLDSIFLILNLLILPFWGLLLFAPRWQWTQRLSGLVAPLILSFLFVILFVLDFPSSGASFGSFGELKTQFNSGHILLATWIHFLAFDLFVGAWILRNGQQSGVPHFRLVPFLLLTMILGPVGFLGYCLIRFFTTKSLDL